MSHPLKLGALTLESLPSPSGGFRMQISSAADSIAWLNVTRDEQQTVEIAAEILSATERIDRAHLVELARKDSECARLRTEVNRLNALVDVWVPSAVKGAK